MALLPRQHGAILIDRADYAELTGDRRVNDAAVWLAPGATPASLMEALHALPGGEALDLADSSEIRAVSLRIFDRSFAVTYAMEAVAVLVGLFGLSSSLGAMVLARRREFGMLRHLGLTRGQIRRMLAAEGALLAGVGAGAGLVCGTAINHIGGISGADRHHLRPRGDGHGTGACGARGLVVSSRRERPSFLQR